MSKLPLITLSKKFHRNEHQILIEFDYNLILINIVKQISYTKWSSSLKSWYIRNNPNNLKSLFSAFKEHAYINSQNLYKKAIKKPKLYTKRIRVLSEENKTVLNNFYKYLKGKRYSISTIRIYTFFVADFIEYHNSRTIESLTNKL